MKLFGSLLLILLFFSPVRTYASLSDTLQVLRLLEQARTLSNNSILGFVHDSTLSAQALELAEHSGWERGIFKGHLWSLLSIHERNFSDGPEAWNRHFQGAIRRRGSGSMEEVVLLYRTIGRMNALNNNTDTAALYIDTAQWAAERSGDKRLLAVITYTRAHNLRRAERWGEAFRLALVANAMAEELDDDLLRATTYNLSGFIRGRLGDLDDAVKDLTLAQALADSMGITALRLQNHYNWAYVMEVKGRWREALEQYRALRASTITMPQESEALPEIDTGIGHMLLRLDSLDQAEKILGRLHRTKAMVGNAYEPWFNSAWALLQLRRGRYQEAVTYAHNAFVTPQPEENDVIRRDASRILAEANKALDRPAEALKWTEIAHQWADSVEYKQQASDAIRVELTRKMATRALRDSLAHAQEIYQSDLAGQQHLSKERNRRNIVLVTAAAILLLSILLWQRLRETRHAKRAIEKEHERSEELLLNILPAEVAAELKEKGHADAKHFEQATILFTDFKGFTEASERMSPQELVEELNTCFKAFDGIITARGIEKIKTIGDAYMCAGGLPVPSSSTPAGVLLAALEMQAFMVARKKERDALNKPAFEMRVGIHTGPVVAGIVGVKKFAYDIWGDTVNTASRMESSGEVGQVNISEATYELVKGEPGLAFSPRGRVQAKGKGELEMYFASQA